MRGSKQRMSEGSRTHLRIPHARDEIHSGAVLDDDRRRVLDLHQAGGGDEMRAKGPRPFEVASRRSMMKEIA
jgi:hypothetical protein